MAQQSERLVKIRNFSPQSTPFIGRREEIAAISEMLADPACRLLTLIGVGGIGKTRLAVEATTHMLNNPNLNRDNGFVDGVHFVSLQPINSTEYLVSTVADAINFLLSGQEEPTQQLLNYLQDKEMLLLLDNFEQLLGEGGARLLSDILEAAPAIKLLVTSREVLNLQEEWLYSIQGLDYPSSTHTNNLESFEAIQLFIERAHRVNRGFSLTGKQEDVIRICQLVDGVPLAIELAAAWTRTLEPGVIAAEIQHNIDFLATSLRNIPDRQQSMRAVFNHSWKLLSEEERKAYKRLSVFRGGFRREAAERIASTSLTTILALVDKSLLRSEADDRYQIHELLRQAAAEKLAYSPEDIAHVYDWHCAYYADFLSERGEDIAGGRQLEAAAEIEADLENIRMAWQWAVEQVKIEEIQKSTGVLALFYQYQSRYTEAVNAFERAAQYLLNEKATEQVELTLALVLVHVGWFYIRLGRLEEAEKAEEQCRAIYERLDIPPLAGFASEPLLALGIIASIRGDYAKTAQLAEQARQMSETHNHRWNRQLAYYVLARAALLQGEYETAHRHAQRAYAITQEVEDRWFMAYCLIELGNVAYALHDYAAAKGHYEASYALRKDFNDPEGMALALNSLGDVAVRQQNHAEAKPLYEQSLAIYKEINDKGGLATSLNGLGNTSMALGDYPTAQQQFRQALQTAAEMDFVPLTLTLLVGIGELLLQTGHEKHGQELLTLAQYHPASEHETKERAQQLLSYYESKLGLDALSGAEQAKESYDLAMITTNLLTDLSTLEVATAVTSPPPSSHHFVPKADQPLIEPLSERELEVLHYVADGLQNREIAEKITVTLSTVKTHINNIYRKLEVNNRVQAVARARELDLL